jgi:hypothetical protein
VRYGVFVMLCLALIGSGCSKPQPKEALETAAGERIDPLDIIERQVRLPARAHPLSDYTRYYHRKGDKVIGRYLLREPKGRRWARKEDVPAAMDGGCSVVNVIFDAATQKIERVFCNGVG